MSQILIHNIPSFGFVLDKNYDRNPKTGPSKH